MTYQEFIAHFCDYNVQWTVVFAAAALIGAWFLKERIGILGASFAAWAVLSAAYTWISPFSPYVGVKDDEQAAIRFHSADATAKLILILAVGLALSRNREKFIDCGVRAAKWLLCANGVMVATQLLLDPGRCSGENACGGIIGNPSMNASFSVSLLPLALGWAGALSTLVILAVSKSNIGFGMLGALVGLLALARLRGRRRLAALVAAPLILLVAAFVLGPKFANSGNRLTMWMFFLSHWKTLSFQIVGTGFGTFPVFSNALQLRFRMMENGWWIWAHNDWLQTGLFELGFVGATLMVGSYLDAVRKLWAEGREALLLSVAMYGIMMAMNYPLHLGPTAAFGAWLMLSALKRERGANGLAVGCV